MSKAHTKYQECCLYFTANSLSRSINAMAEESFRSTGLAPSYGYLMLLLIDKPGLSQNELSLQMNLQASTMTRFVDKLVAMNLAKRKQEGRTVFIYPTEDGKKMKRKIDRALTDLYTSYCELLGEEFAVKLTADIHKANQLLNDK